MDKVKEKIKKTPSDLFLLPKTDAPAIRAIAGKDC